MYFLKFLKVRSDLSPALEISEKAALEISEKAALEISEKAALEISEKASTLLYPFVVEHVFP